MKKVSVIASQLMGNMGVHDRGMPLQWMCLDEVQSRSSTRPGPPGPTIVENTKFAYEHSGTNQLRFYNVEEGQIRLFSDDGQKENFLKEIQAHAKNVAWRSGETEQSANFQAEGHDNR